MSSRIDHSPLGQTSAYQTHYDPSLLFPIERAESRAQLPGGGATFYGVDIWTGFELSWLNERGLPQVALLELVLPADSPRIVESKSLKLYLNSFNQTTMRSAETVRETVERDVSEAAGAPVRVAVTALSETPLSVNFAGALERGQTLDNQDLAIDVYEPCPEFLQADPARPVAEAWHSDLLKTNCPVTGQPDWASLWIEYEGPAIDPAGLLRYIVSFREHQDFHEHCVERIFTDITRRCEPQKLTVYARYTRRGGLDINPYRSSEPGEPPALRLVRQ